jgi:hypothetical protein
MSVPVLDAASNGNSTTGAIALSWSHTCSGSNRYLTVALFFNGALSSLAVTYDGVAMTQIGTITGGGVNAYFFGLANPETGANIVSATWATTRAAIGTSVSYTNVNQSSPFGTGVTVASTTSPTSGNITLTSNDIGVGFLASYNSTTTVPTITSSGTGQTDRTTQYFQGGTTSARLRQADITGTGTVSMAWTSTGVQRLLIAYPLQGISAVPSNFFLMF